MKTKRRHELQTNDLADQMGQYIQKVKPYTAIILGSLAVAIVLAVGIMYFISQQKAQRGQSWSSFYLAFGSRDPEALVKVSEVYSGMAAGAWAEKSAADIRLAEGISQLFTDRELANTTLTDAKASYTAALKSAREPILRRQARYGLAQAQEALGELDEAKKSYEQVAKEATGTALAEAAAERIKQLESPQTQEWYAWFGKQKPAPPKPPKNNQGPFDDLKLDNIPERPDLSFPGLDPLGSDEESPLGKAFPDAGKGSEPKDVPEEEGPKEPAPPEE